MIEVWKDIPGYVGEYLISSHGRVRSLTRKIVTKTGRIYALKGRFISCKNGEGLYSIAHLYKHNVGESVYVHRLVAEAFVPNPNGKPEVNHVDGNVGNNMADNLEWVTCSENALHAIEIGLTHHAVGEKASGSKLKEHEVSEIRELLSQGLSSRSVGKRYCVTHKTVLAIKHRESWKHI